MKIQTFYDKIQVFSQKKTKILTLKSIFLSKWDASFPSDLLLHSSSDVGEVVRSKVQEGLHLQPGHLF